MHQSAFASVGDVQERLSAAGYLTDHAIATTVFLADRLGKPLLVEGPAGVGKTELAKAVAAATGAELIRLQCYEGLDEARALYEWNYKKQLLRIQASSDDEKWSEVHDDVFAEEFLLSRPLLTAIRRTEPTVLLIDETDKADVEVEGLLLEVLSDFQVTIPELGTITATRRPIVVLTSNATRELSEALKRRCLYLHLDYPAADREKAIVLSRVPEVPERLADQLVADGPRPAGAGAQEVAEHRGVHRLGAHAGRAGARHARRGRRAGHPRRGAQARQRPRPGGQLVEAGPAPVKQGGLLGREIAFFDALREAGVPVALSEVLDATRAMGAIDLLDREALRQAFAATAVKRPNHRPTFDRLFDLWWPAVTGDPSRGEADLDEAAPGEGEPPDAGAAARRPARPAAERRRGRAAPLRPRGRARPGPRRRRRRAAELVLLPGAAGAVAGDADGLAAGEPAGRTAARRAGRAGRPADRAGAHPAVPGDGRGRGASAPGRGPRRRADQPYVRAAAGRAGGLPAGEPRRHGRAAPAGLPARPAAGHPARPRADASAAAAGSTSGAPCAPRSAPAACRS